MSTLTVNLRLGRARDDAPKLVILNGVPVDLWSMHERPEASEAARALLL